MVVQVFRIVLMEAHTDHVDDYDECEWSLCSPCALLLPLLRWYGADLSLRCRRMVAALIFFTKTQGTVELPDTAFLGKLIVDV